MSTLGDVVKAKIVAAEATLTQVRADADAALSKAEAEVTNLRADLAAFESNTTRVLETDVEAIKTWFQALGKHLDL